MITTKKRGGLANVVAGQSSICLCGADDESLLIRGYTIEDLAEKASFEEVAYLLLREKLPTFEELKDYKKLLKSERTLPSELKKLIPLIPKSASPMELLRTAVSFMGPINRLQNNKSPFHEQDQLISLLTPILLNWYLSKECSESKEETIAGYFLHELYGKAPTDLERRALDLALILYAEHEFNASTFTVRTIASTMSDYYSAICGGIGALWGPLHGGANEWAYSLIKRFKTVDEAENAILNMLNNKQLVMGFGHRVYTTNDPRSNIVKKWAKRLSEKAEDAYLFDIAEKIESVMWREKMLFPNLDFYSALLFHWLKIPVELFTPLFVLSRISGWSAHFIEQQKNNKLIRPLSEYMGPKSRRLPPLESR